MKLQFVSHNIFCVLGQFNKAWHTQVEIQSTDSEINIGSVNKRKSKSADSTSSDSDVEGNYYYYYYSLLRYSIKYFNK